MKILIIGSGGREYALAKKIQKEDREVILAPGNGGSSQEFRNVDIDVEDNEALVTFAKEENIDYTIVGPEVPLCNGIVDDFQKEGLEIFGVNKKASQFESSKIFTKSFLEKYGIKTSPYLATSELDEAMDFARASLDKDSHLVIKRDGLAQGKGVSIVDNIDEAQAKIKEILDQDQKILLEEFVAGFEMSLLVLTDSEDYLVLPSAKDHKKIYENEEGQNTGGMGTYAPNIEADAYVEGIKEDLLPKIMKGFKEEGIDYRGVLFIGFMINENGAYVLEFNVRFGDPETQVVLELIDNDILELLRATSQKKLSQVDLKTNNKKAICLVLASGGYPGAYDKGKEITFDKEISSQVYHAGTDYKDGKYYTAGGRVLNLIAVGDSFDEAINTLYEDAEKIHFGGKYYRKDIGPRVKRVYVSKKDRFDRLSPSIKKDLETALNIKIEDLKIYNRYDVQTSRENLEKLIDTVLSEPPVDEVYAFDEAFRLQASMTSALVRQYLPGQFDQRKKGVLDTAQLIIDQDDLDVRTATVYDFKGVDPKDMARIESYLINPVDSHRVNLVGVPTSLAGKDEKNLENIVYEGFRDFDLDDLENFVEENSLAMNVDDLKLVRDYFREEDRDPNETEIKILDTYWSDHCRHTTFNTFIDVDFDPVSLLDETIKETFDKYVKMREELNITKPINLMSFGTILAKYMRANDNFADLEVSDEINACSIYTKVRVVKDGKESLEDYLLMFKNETHNHPTEIEPFGGASTCLGGAIRDPLSGRSYVYQAMRLSGAGNILENYEDTLDGKLPQAKITKEAAKGYSSYGNQIGLATGLVDEFYHPGFKAKRMELGAVVAAAPSKNVKRLTPEVGDIVILLGGRTGRDGIGGATGSSKSHKVSSIKTESAQVQKGNAPEERKIQRLFRREEVASLIKKSNDFGAGGVSVAIGELYDGLDIHLEQVPLKYQALKPVEIAISESQERMAVVIKKSDKEKFISYCKEENIEATEVATVTDDRRMTLYYEDQVVADLSYDFINTNGANRYQDVKVKSEEIPDLLTEKSSDPSLFYDKVGDLNITSKKNLIEIFDSSIGRGTVLSPLGGRKQLNPTQVMAALIPTDKGLSKTASIMAYGYDPYLAEASQYLGGYYAVIESISKLIAVGSDLEQIRLSFQEYYEKLTDPYSWSKPLKSLLGAFEASSYFMMPPIGGKDSMSGTFEDITVPPSLVSFAITTEDVEHIISNDLKGKGRLGLVAVDYLEDGRIDLDKLKANYEFLIKDIREGNIISAIALDRKGLLADIYEQALGNTGFSLDYNNLYSPMYGSFVVEYLENRDFIEEIGSFSDEIIVNGKDLDKARLEEAYLHTLDPVFPPKDDIAYEELNPSRVERRLKSNKPVDEVRALILATPGTNCEWDTMKALEKAGAKAEILVFCNQDQDDIEDSIDRLVDGLAKAQIFALPGGFSLGDEPDGSGKFIANILRNERVSQAIDKFLAEDGNDGIIIGICNGFQALMKTGLLTNGRVSDLKDTDPTLTINTVPRHIASFVDTRLITDNSLWTTGLDKDKTYKMPISHGEGRFILNEETYKAFLANDQIFSVYENSPNGSDYNIEGIISKDGKILGRMGHQERVDDDLFKNIYSIEEEKIFDNAVKFFRKED